MKRLQSYGELAIGHELESEVIGGVPHYRSGQHGEQITPAQYGAEPWIAAWYVNAMGNLCLVPFRFKGNSQKLEPVGWTLVCWHTSATMAIVEEGWNPSPSLTRVIKTALRRIRAHG